MIYLDHHATCPMPEPVRAAVADALTLCGNPSSVHRFGQQMRHRIESVRERLAGMVGLPGGRVVFTSGGTEAIALALGGASRVFCAATDHAAVLAQVPEAQRIAVTATGVLDLDALEHALAEPTPTTWVSVQYANSETGIIQPLTEISGLVHRKGGLLHVDAVQGFGRLPLEMRSLGIDGLSLAGHKIGAPPGIGALVLPMTLPLTPQIPGGGQERGKRGGTENWLGIVGLGAALDWLDQHGQEKQTHLQRLDAVLAGQMAESSVPVEVVGSASPRVPGCHLLLADGFDAQSILMELDLQGIAVSSGSACSSGTVADSHVLRAMGIDATLRRSAIRVSIGADNTETDVIAFASAYRAILERDMA